jgi:peptidoglycan L-alanyl-D-glutamate endopeptidase CwlK
MYGVPSLALMDPISETRLSAVNPELARRIHQLQDMLEFPILVTQGLRTWAEQDALYAQGRTAPGRIVTEAKGGESMHNFGLAVDVAPTDGHSIDWNGRDAKWEAILAKAPTVGLAEGAAWRTYPDEPHLYPQEVPASPDDNMRYLYTEGGLAAVWQEYSLV